MCRAIVLSVTEEQPDVSGRTDCRLGSRARPAGRQPNQARAQKKPRHVPENNLPDSDRPLRRPADRGLDCACEQDVPRQSSQNSPKRRWRFCASSFIQIVRARSARGRQEIADDSFLGRGKGAAPPVHDLSPRPRLASRTRHEPREGSLRRAVQCSQLPQVDTRATVDGSS